MRTGERAADGAALFLVLTLAANVLRCGHVPANDDLFRSGSILVTRERLRRLAAAPELPKLYSEPTRAERTGGICLVLAGVAVSLSIVYAVFATVTAPPMHHEWAGAEAAPLAAARQPAVFQPAPVAARASLPIASDPLRWEDLTLMLRTGWRDDEIIAEAANKQLVLSIDPAREETLRHLGAGTRLLGYLRTRRVYAAPVATEAERVIVTARPVAIAAAATQPVYQPAPVATPDYAARDRQVQSLKTQIDALDEQVRSIRANPKDNRYWWHYYGRFNGIDQQKLDAYLNTLDQERNDLRRQKWQVEGR